MSRQRDWGDIAILVMLVLAGCIIMGFLTVWVVDKITSPKYYSP